MDSFVRLYRTLIYLLGLEIEDNLTRTLNVQKWVNEVVALNQEMEYARDKTDLEAADWKLFATRLTLLFCGFGLLLYALKRLFFPSKRIWRFVTMHWPFHDSIVKAIECNTVR
jgi:hypothetical protein